MHGTPAQELFSRSRRDFSHGCIRLEDPATLGVWVLRDPRAWPLTEVQRAMAGPKPRQVNLARPLPVVIYYTTAVARNDGSVAFFDDVYRHDARLEQELAKGYPFAP
jgi:murein L,D-transpeptidase YcbB/YkuD